MRNRVVAKVGLGLLGCCLIQIASLCSSTWAADSPPPQISRDSQSSSISYPRIAIVIDDLGYNRAVSQRAVQLPGAVTLSVLPHSPHGRRIAHLGHRQGKELMLHVPMSSITDKTLEPATLTLEMPKAQFLTTLNASLADLPFIRGVNNHMGSELTQYRQPMSWLMESLRQRSLYFVDSRTIAASLAWETALSQGVSSIRRDVFLDNDVSYPAIAEQFGKLLRIAKHHGSALAIAHPYPETLHFLEAALPMLATAGIELVPVSELLTKPGLVPTTAIAEKLAMDRPHEMAELTNH